MKKRYFFLFIGFMLSISPFGARAQNLLVGWDNTSGTPYNAGWRVDGSVSGITWGVLNATTGNRFRTNVGSPASNGTDPMLYITAADTKFGYPVTPTAKKIYQLSGKAWRRNGTSGSVTFNFYLANNLLATNPASKTSLTVSGNNVASTFSSLRLVAPEGFTSGYFLWDVHVNSGSWAEAGVWLLNMTELGNAIPVKFDTGGGSAVTSQYFLEGESYKVSKPADPTKNGYIFDSWYSDAGLTNAYDFSSSVTTNTTIYAKWSNIKGELITLITTANGLLSGGTTKGQSYMNAEIAAAQVVVDNSSSTVEQVTAAYNALTAAISAYKDASLSNLQINSTSFASFSATTYAYNYDVATNATVPAVSAMATATSAATVAVTQVSALPGTATVVVTAGDGSTKTYTVNFRFNYMLGWDGNGTGTTTDIPSTFGWTCSSAVTWTDASNTNDTYAYRYRDNLGVGRVITHPVKNNVFSFPVALNGGKVYNFTCNNSNFNGAVSTMFGINTSSDATGTMLVSQTKTAPQWTASTTVDFTFSVATTGTYYLVWQTTNGSDRNFAWNFLIKELGNAGTVSFNTDGGSQVTSQYFVAGSPYTVVAPADPTKDGYTFAGWFTSNSYAVPFNFSASVSGSTTVYARFVPQGSTTSTDVVIDNNTLSLPAAKYMNITVNGTSELHVSSESAPLVNSTVNLTSDNSWLYFDAVKPSVVSSDYLSSVKINGQPFNSQTDRMAIYGGGTVIIPNGKVTGTHALTAYKGDSYSGESMSFEVNKYYRTAELGTFDNNIRSFKLKKGYSCTFANNPDGTGFSRVYIASDADIEVPVMPEGLGFASFVRVFRWEWVGKKGICNGGLADITNSSWYNDWAAGGATDNPDFEYVPMRHNLGWDSFTTINSRANVSHVLGYNEPDHTDQANCTPEQAIRQWPELFKSGLRLGSPTPDAIRKRWLVDFLAQADSLNYRVDFVVGHMYWNGQSGQNLYNGVTDACTRLYGGRPMWITEWNNGANWTTESWPTASGPQRDADLNIIYDATGNTKTINRPLSPENAAKQLAWIQDALDGLNRCEYLERHSLYNWVQDARTMVLGNKLTPAGKYFAAYKSKVAFTKAREYIHTWKIAPPLPNYTLSNDYKTFIVNWYDHNGETGKTYLLERKLEGETDFTPLATLTAVQDYAYGGNVTYSDPIGNKSAQYRVKAMSYKNTESIYSRTVTLTLDPVVTAPADLTGTAVSTSIIDLSWSLISGARSYNLKRATSIDGTYETVGRYLTATPFRDSGLTPNTTYYYKISSLNNLGETVDSNPVAVTTKAIAVPTVIQGIFSSNGDAKATLTWDFQYDVLYRIYRSDKEVGEYVKIADNVDTTRYVDKGLVNGQTYYYKVAAFNSAGEFINPTIFSLTPQPGQYAYFNFDETSGLVHDLWGGYHGTPSATTSVTGKVNTGLSFVAGSQSYVQLQNGLTSELNDFTISFWTNISSKGSRIFDFGNSTSAFMMLTPDLRYKITCPTGTYDVTATGYTLPTGEWTYVTLTQEGTNFKMYANGTLIFEDNKATVKPSDIGENHYNYLVKSRWTGNSYSSCTFDEFKIYNRALSVDEIKALMNGSIYSVKLSRNTLSLNVGVTHQLIKTIFPDNVSTDGLIWNSSNEAAVTVVNGLVTAKGSGSATVRVSTADGLVEAICSVVVVTAPSDLKGKAVSTSIIDLFWTPISGASSYNLKRSTSINGIYETVGKDITTATFRDSGLTPNTPYYYKISSLNNLDETIDSNPVAIAPYVFKQSVASGGNWSAPATWEDNVVPVATDNIVIASSGIVTVDVNPAVCNDLNIQNGATLNVAPTKALTVNGTFTNNAGNSGFVIQSAAMGTGTFVDNATTPNTAVVATVQQYLPSVRNWYTSSPVSGATAPAGNTYYKYIEAANNGIDWITVSSGSAFEVMTGYIVKPDATSTFIFSGVLNTGPQQITNLTSAATSKTGFNLVGNPYPSYVNWMSAAKTNLSTSIWYRTQNSASTPTYVYDTYNETANTGTNNNGVAAVTGMIPPMQAFWVKVDAGKIGTLAFDNNTRSHQDISTNIFRAPAANGTQQVLCLQVSNGTNSDEAIVLFNANAIDGYDAYDSPKMPNGNAAIPEIYTSVGTEKMVINGLNSVTTNKMIPLGFATGATNTFSIKASRVSNFEADTKIVLKDNMLKVEQDITDGTPYNFISDVASTDNRFSVVFKTKSSTTGIDNYEKKETIIVSKNANNQIVVTSNTNNQTGVVTVSNAVGQKLHSIAITGVTTLITKSFTPGVYLVTVNEGDKSVTKKIIIN